MTSPLSQLLSQLETKPVRSSILNLDRIRALMMALGNPHHRLPPSFHVAGTNGKGSTCAYIRAVLEAAGHAVHVYTSPHLVRYNERIRLGGRLIEDEILADGLQKILPLEPSREASSFEILTAVALATFAEVRADAAIIEVGLGGRLDATNILVAPAICGIAQLGTDHVDVLGASREAIASEKSGIIKPGTPVVTLHYEQSVRAVIAGAAARADTTLYAMRDAWDAEVRGDRVMYWDGFGALELPRPRLSGDHQCMNLALATAMIRHQPALKVGDEDYARGARDVVWPARLETLGAGPLRNVLDSNFAVWLDGGHNGDAGKALAEFFRGRNRSRPLHIIVGMIAGKDPEAFLTPLLPLASSVLVVPVADHENAEVSSFVSSSSDSPEICEDYPTVESALQRLSEINDSGDVLLAGSLYLAGQILELNRQFPH